MRKLKVFLASLLTVASISSLLYMRLGALPADPGGSYSAGGGCSGFPLDCYWRAPTLELAGEQVEQRPTCADITNIPPRAEHLALRVLNVSTAEQYTSDAPVTTRLISVRAPGPRSVSRKQEGGVERTISFASGHAPSWVNFATWADSGKALLVIDVSSGSVFHVALTDEIVRQVIVSSLNTSGILRPKNIQSLERDLLVEQEGGDFYQLGDDYTLSLRMRVMNKETSGGQIRSVFNWTAGSQGVLVFGDTARESGQTEEWNTSLILVPWESSKSPSVLDSLEIESTTRQFSRMGFPILATAKGKTFFLKVDGQAQLYKIESGLQLLDVIPDEFRKFPEIEKRMTSESIPRIFSDFSKATATVGVYGTPDGLFLLFRRRDDEQVTRWAIGEVDIERGVLIRTVPLPTTKPHIVLVPGKEEWAVIEKEQVIDYKTQPVGNIVIIPADELFRSGGVT